MRTNLIPPLLLLASITLHTNLLAQSFRVKRIQRDQHTVNSGVVKTDSAVFYYSGTNGKPVTWQWAELLSLGHRLCAVNPLLQYDSMVNRVNYEQIAPYWEAGTYRAEQKFTGPQLVEYKQYFANKNGGFTLQETQTHTYTGNLLTESKLNSTTYKYTYSNGLLLQTDMGTRKIYYSYDANGNLMLITEPYTTADTIFTEYKYNSQNLLIEKARRGHYYYPTTVIDTLWRDVYIYDTNNDLMQETRYTSPYSGSNTTVLTSIRHSSYDVLRRKTKLLSFYADYPNFTVDLQERRTFTYDKSGLLIKLENMQWNGTDWALAADTSAVSSSHTYTFDYEVGWPTTVPEAEDAANVKLYPSPASDFIRIETEWKQATPFTAAILDMQGRVIRQWNEPATKNYARIIPLTELPTGNYILKLNCGEEQYSKQFAVYK